MTKLTEAQMQAVEAHRLELNLIQEAQTLRKVAMAAYIENMRLRDSYRQILNHHVMIESLYTQSLLGD